MKIFEILSTISGITAGLGWYLSMRQYFKIKAEKENRKYKNIFYEHTVIGVKSIFGGDFIEYFPLTLLLKKLDSTEYNKLNSELKNLYNKKFNYERIFWLSILCTFIFVGFATGWKITQAGIR